MSMDFDVKPVQPIAGSTASPYISSGDVARGAVPTQLPLTQAVRQPEASERVRKDTRTFEPPIINKVIIDKAAAAIVFQTVDDRTSEIIGQYPADSMLRRRAYLRALDEIKTEMPKPLPTNRKI